MSRNPKAGFATVLQQSDEVCQEAYQWLFRPNRTAAQDRSIRILIEHDAFQQIHKAWKRHGFPFDRLVPSYATAIGSSGDTPAALAELMGIILSDGIAYPSRRLAELRFAEQTPFETVMRPRAKEGERVIPAPVAALLKKELTGVVEKGTGRRAFGSLTLRDGKPIVIGGKTGTGDNRIESRRTNSSRVINRTATFVFFFDDRFFGTVTAFVNGPDAANYKFTSSLPVQVFRNFAPTFQSLLQQPSGPRSQPGEVSQAGRLIAKTH
jgi:membrane peptidoglycan carboxypeptidase